MKTKTSLDEFCRRTAGLKDDPAIVNGLAKRLGVTSASTDPDVIKAAAYEVFGRFDTSNGYVRGRSLRQALKFISGKAYRQAMNAYARTVDDDRD